MHLQTFFPEMGDDAKLRLQLTVIEEQIESINRLRRHSLKVKNWMAAANCDKELLDLRETERATRSLLEMRQHCTPVRLGPKANGNSGSHDGQPVSAYTGALVQSEPEPTLKSNSPFPLCGGVGATQNA